MHQILGKLLAALNACCRACGTKQTQAVGLEYISNTCLKCYLGTCNGEADAICQSKLLQLLYGCLLYGYALGQCSNTRIARCAKDLLYLGRLAQRLNDGVATTARTYY